MKEIRKIDNMKVRQLCIQEKYYTSGTNEDYDNLLFHLCNKEDISLEDLEEIAADILFHSIWEDKAKECNCDYDELLAYVIGSLINKCCYSYIELN